MGKHVISPFDPHDGAGSPARQWELRPESAGFGVNHPGHLPRIGGFADPSRRSRQFKDRTGPSRNRLRSSRFGGDGMQNPRGRWLALAVVVVTALTAQGVGLGRHSRRRRPLPVAGRRPGREGPGLGEAAEREDARGAGGPARVQAHLRADARDPRLEGEDPDAGAPRRHGLQLLEGRRPRARDLAAHDARVLSYGRIRSGRRCSTWTRWRRPRASPGSSRARPACPRPTRGA